MAQDKAYFCGECAEEFVIAGGLYACPDWVLRCPGCGSICVLLIARVAEAASVWEPA
jgi:hypothetical protein